MEIPMKEIINSYRQQLSDAVHKTTLQDVHITLLKKALQEKDEKIKDLETVIKEYEPTYGGQENVDPT